MATEVESRLEALTADEEAERFVLGLRVVRADEDSFRLPELFGSRALTMGQAARAICGQPVS